MATLTLQFIALFSEGEKVQGASEKHNSHNINYKDFNVLDYYSSEFKKQNLMHFF